MHRRSPKCIYIYIQYANLRLYVNAYIYIVPSPLSGAILQWPRKGGLATMIDFLRPGSQFRLRNTGGNSEVWNLYGQDGGATLCCVFLQHGKSFFSQANRE